MKLPQTVGPYRLVELLGSGSFGTVYRAEVVGALGFSQDVAVKVLDPAKAIERPDMVASLADEAALLSRLQHPYIVSVRGLEKIEHDFLGTTYAMVMELVRGIPLRRLIDASNERGLRVPVQACLLLLSEVAEALQYAHELTGSGGEPLNFVHRDMKPGNILVTKAGRTKILDFGIAFATERKVSSTADGMTKGTVLYMSPEQVRGQPLDGRSDVYSLGLILFELLTGELFIPLPKGGLADIAGILTAVSEVGWYDRVDLLKERLRAPEPEGHGLGEPQAEFVEMLLAGMLQPDPEDRADAHRLVEMLDELDSAWRLKRGRRMLKDLVRAEYATFDEVPALREHSASELPSDDAISLGHAELQAPTPIESVAAAPDGRDPDAAIKPVPPTRIVPARTDPETPAREVAAGTASLERPVASDPPPRRGALMAVLGLLLLLLGVYFATRGGEPDPADALPPLTPAEPVAEEDEAAPPEPEPPADDPSDEEVADGGSAAPADDDDSAGARVADEEDAVAAPAEPPPARASAPVRRPRRSTPRPAPEPTPEPTPEPVAAAERRALVALIHDPPRFVVLGAPLRLSVGIEIDRDGQVCQPRVILAPKNRRKYRRYPMAESGANRFTATIDVPYDDEWAQGVRYFVECCWGTECPVRWRGPGAPMYLRTPEF